MKPLMPLLRARTRSTSCALALAIAAALVAVSPVQAAKEAGMAQVGAVSFVLGKAWIKKPGERRARVDVGTVVGVHDRIETDSNGHVHIRFVDTALVSVRPSSTLDVVRYDYDPAAPAESAVKLDLEEGVARAISGEAAREARQNFRMNTPIAAIGVRGTDFVVSASRDSVRAQVNEGAIVVAPFSLDCSVDAFGPCSANALELTGLSREVLEISAATLSPVLLPTTTGEASDMVFDPATAVAATTEETNEKSGDLYTESVSARAVNQQLAENRLPPPVSPPAAPEFTPDLALTSAALTENQLVWGRWSDGARSANERITVSYATATEPGRAVTIGNSAYALYRIENDGTKEVQRGLNTLDFNLSQAQAMYTTEGRSELMKVYGGDLSIDFNLNHFATSLQLNHAATGNVNFSSSGKVHGGGYFHNRGGVDDIAGAVSIDGTQAGYFFEKALENGHIDGITLWGLQP